ncbi:hypothetical protein [Stenotrophomonas sp. ZAC14D2_NAIMI4_6]|uniref:hypothetical protein n=1 Tax=Stenotrophomonas sp. ZAC14D2_NAIMI4_6 TaxID=2072406 RepID=UPI000D53CD02|nr:hypothetical protein [Stenotrophomonas sp. ZAC14D2_NAIMI4_6]AWH19989.1 hypothetical protein C1933_01350 [Stenotrophomonas sp. ZAC14D2_NAIMI4_6]
MTRPPHPFLTATLGDAAAQLPPELARPLEAAFAAANEVPDPLTLPACLQRLRAGEAADGQPWRRPVCSPAQGQALARADRANTGLTTVLELLHAAERVRVDGATKDDIGDATREGLLLACRGLAEYVGQQLQAA